MVSRVLHAQLSVKGVLQKMMYTTNTTEYLLEDGATNNEIDFFFVFLSFVAHLKMQGKNARYEVYSLWTRLLRLRRTPYKNHARFDFHNDLKWYWQNKTKGESDDDNLSSDAVVVNPESFVKFVVRHLDETL